jgi:hypothetical protein
MADDDLEHTIEEQQELLAKEQVKHQMPGSFIDPNERINQAHALDVLNGNKKLNEQQQLIGHKIKRMMQSGGGINPMDMLMIRMNLILDWILPADPQGEEGNESFGNYERILFEQAWNETCLRIYDEILKQMDRVKLMQGVHDNGQQPQGVAVDMAGIARKVMTEFGK